MSSKQPDSLNNHEERYADRSVWIIWGVLLVIAVAVLPFVVRNSEVAQQIAAMCGFVVS